ncbi:MMPL family transporter [Nocardioides korecus]
MNDPPTDDVDDTRTPTPSQDAEPSTHEAAQGTPSTLGAVGFLARVAHSASRRRWLTLGGWFAALILLVIVSGAAAGEYDADYTAAGSDSRAARDLLDEQLPQASAEVITLLARGDDVDSGAARAATEDLIDQLSTLPHVESISTPYDAPEQISDDKSTALAQIRLDVDRPSAMPTEDTQAIMDAVEEASGSAVSFAVNGQVVADVQNGSGGPEVIGLVAALVILLLTFGSLIASGLPVLIAVAGLAISSSLIGLLALMLSVPPWAPALAAMLGIGVGIDYVLLIVTRHRENLHAGLPPRQASLASIDTAGRSVMVAGTTVIVSLLGLVLTGLSYLQGAAVSAMLAILVVMAASLTLLPALLAITGTRIDKLALPWASRSAGASSRWTAWARLVQRHSWPATILGTLVLIALTLPIFGVRFGLPDAHTDPTDTTTRQAYDWTTEAFGVGTNGPLILAVSLDDDPSDSPGDSQGDSQGGEVVLTDLANSIAADRDVAAVSPPQTSPDGQTAVLSVIPRNSPQSKRTTDLVHRLRDTLNPAAIEGTDSTVYVGGPTAAAIDFNEDIANRIPLLIIGVVTLALLLLLLTFRSIAIAAKAAVLNLLSIGAAYGVIALVLQGGWLGQLVGIDNPTPLPAYIPVLVFAILFGLSMDYEVFLVGRMHEHYTDHGDSDAAVASGLASTGRVVTAAAAIMVAVFASFVPSVNLTLKLLGVGLATAILVDATVVRMALVPAIMKLHGRYAWWMPQHLDRLLPQVRLEPTSATTDLQRVDVPAQKS